MEIHTDTVVVDTIVAEAQEGVTPIAIEDIQSVFGSSSIGKSQDSVRHVLI